jgi:hypothetical protein
MIGAIILALKLQADLAQEVINKHLPQSIESFLPEDSEKRLLPPEKQQSMATTALRDFLSPWFSPIPEEKFFRKLAKVREKFFRTGAPELYTSSKRPFPVFHEIYREAQMACSPPYLDVSGFPGIVTETTYARYLPTDELLLKEPNAFPFDENIKTLLPAGTPVQVLGAFLPKREWVWVSSSFSCGWCPAKAVAQVSPREVKSFSKKSWKVAIQDDISLIDHNTYLGRAHIGTLWPVGRNRNSILVPIKREDGYCQWKEIPAQESLFADFPWPLTYRAIGNLISVMLGQGYGWGGFLEKRDCSSTIRDLMIPFGIFLPRNSRYQLKEGQAIPSHLSLEERDAYIRQQGQPFVTIVGFPGHVMLYLGPTTLQLGDSRRERAVFFQNIWALATESDRRGRFVIGQAIVSSLFLGKEPVTDIPHLSPLAFEIKPLYLRHLIPASVDLSVEK